MMARICRHAACTQCMHGTRVTMHSPAMQHAAVKLALEGMLMVRTDPRVPMVPNGTEKTHDRTSREGV